VDRGIGHPPHPGEVASCGGGLRRKRRSGSASEHDTFRYWSCTEILSPRLCERVVTQQHGEASARLFGRVAHGSCPAFRLRRSAGTAGVPGPAHWLYRPADSWFPASSGPATKSCNKFGAVAMLKAGPTRRLPMRGRQPTPLTISAADRPILEAVARSRRLSWFQVQHARIVLAVAGGEPVYDVAARLECHRATVWRICRRYEQGGLSKLLLDDPRVGRPQEISPPAARPDRRAGLPGASRRGAGDHALDQRRPSPPGRRRRDRASHQPGHDPPHLATGGLAAAPHALLAHGAAGRSLQGAGREGAVVLRECGAVGPPGRLGRLHRRGPQPPGAGAGSDPQGDPRPHRAAGVRVHPARHGQPAAVPRRPHRRDGIGRPGGE